MTTLEIISRLCGITTELSEIVRKQQETIERSKVEEAVKEELRQMVDGAERELDVIEYNSRKYCDVDDIERKDIDIYEVEVTTVLMMEIEAKNRKEAEERARREYMDFMNVSPQKVKARKRGEKQIDG